MIGLGWVDLIAYTADWKGRIGQENLMSNI